MAAVCKLVRDSSTLVDFQGGSTGFQLVSWRPKVSRLVDGEPMPVMETLTVTVAGTDQDNLASYLQSLGEAQYWADAYLHDRNVEDPVWFHVQMNNETNERRAFVHSIEWGHDSGYYDERAVTAETDITVTIERGVWERASSRQFPAARPRALGFDSGSAEFNIGEKIEGASSGATGMPAFWIVTSGAWGTGDAAGTVYLSDSTSGWTDNESIDLASGGALDIATVNGTIGGCLAAVYNYTEGYSAGIAGDIAARVAYFGLEAVDSLGKFWIGIRSDEKSVGDNASEFLPIIEIELGNQVDTDATAETDAGNTASPYTGTGNDHVRITEGTSGTNWDDGDWHLAWDESLIDVGVPDLADQFGLLKWLLRAKVGSGATWELQLRLGYAAMSNTDFIRFQAKELDATSWDIFDCGNQYNPLRDLQVIPTARADPSQFEGDLTIQYWARRTAGTADLYLDCLCLLPMDEGYLISELGVNTAAGDKLRFAESAIGATQVMSWEATADWTGIPSHEENAFRLPPGGGRMFIIYAKKNSSVLDNALNVLNGTETSYFERWLSLRGSE